MIDDGGIWLLELAENDADGERPLFSEWFPTRGQARTVCTRMNRQTPDTQWRVVKFRPVAAPGNGKGESK